MAKAVLLAGGQGTRLRPLTCARAKPMVPILGRPVMAYGLELLRRHGIEQAAVTLQYMPETIADYFGNGGGYGVELSYFHETVPLGTAGCVKNAASALDQTFVVLSGDALTDFDLSAALSFHKRRGAAATMLLKSVGVPLEYGVVMTADDGRVQRFIEKPGWAEVFSDTVNTGIYIIEPEVLDLIPEQTSYDFSKDVFAQMLEKDMPLMGYTCEGYWCDIGDIWQYMQAQRDVLEGKVNVSIDAPAEDEGVYISPSASVSTRAHISGPCYIGSGARVEYEANIGEYSVIGADCVIEPRADVKRSVLWEGAQMRRAATARGIVLCAGAKMLKGSQGYEGAVLGDASVLGEGAVLKPGAKVWPHKNIGGRLQQRENLVWAERNAQSLFGRRGACAACGADMTPAFSASLGSAFVAAAGPGAYAVCYVSGLKTLALAAAAGIASMDSDAQLLPDASPAVLCEGIRALGLRGAIDFEFYQGEPCARLWDAQGLVAERALERKVEEHLARGDYERGTHENDGAIASFESAWLIAARSLRFLEGQVEESHISVGLCGETPHHAAIPLLKRLGVQVEWMGAARDRAQAQRLLKRANTDVGVFLSADQHERAIADDEGRLIEPHVADSLFCRVQVARGVQTLHIPYAAPAHCQAMAEKEGIEYRRDTSDSRAVMRQLIEENPGDTGRILALCHADPLMLALAAVLSVKPMGVSLSEYIRALPKPYLMQRWIDCGWERKGGLLRDLARRLRPNGQGDDAGEGVRIQDQRGWALVLPDSDGPGCNLYVEGMNEAFARELCLSVEQIIRKSVR